MVFWLLKSSSTLWRRLQREETAQISINASSRHPGRRRNVLSEFNFKQLWGGGSGREGSTTTIGNPIVHAWAIAPSIGNPIVEKMHFMRVKFVFIFGLGVVT